MGGRSVRNAVSDAGSVASVPGAAAEEDAELLAWNGRLTGRELNQARAEIEQKAMRRLRRLLDTTA